MTTPPKPDVFDPEVPPPGFESKLVPFWEKRPKIKPRLQLVHTNGASGEGSIESSYNWTLGNLDPGYLYGNPPGDKYRTIPHLQIDRSGRGAMLLPADRKGIANYKAADFSLGFETADRGYLTDPYPTGSYFTPEQAEAVAVACAWYAWGYGIPLEYPATWDGSGTACHTEPFGFDKWTNSSGKPCPGDRKKFQVRDTILPRAREIVAAWTTPPVGDEVTDEDIQRIVAAMPPPAPLSKEDVDRIVAGVYARLLRTPSGDKPASTVLEWIKDDTIKTLRAVQDLAVLPSPKAG